MEVIAPTASGLVQTGTSILYAYDPWSGASVPYAEGAIVRRLMLTGWKDFLAIAAHVSASGNGPPFVWYWEEIGRSASLSGGTYATNVALSIYPTWASGAIAEGYVCYDPADRRDYRAHIAMSAGENTARPSAAVTSSDEAIRSRWLDLGAANAFALLDYSTNTYLVGVDSAGATLSVPVVFSADIDTPTPVDRVCFAGLINVQTVQAKISVAGSVVQTVSGSLIPSGTAETYGITHRTAILPITPVAAGAELKVEVTLTRYATTEPLQLGAMCVGRGLHLAGTEWGVQTSILPFSMKERNETFGLTRFIKRGSARLAKATAFIDPDIISGDVVQQILANYEGMPIYFDFNNAGCGYDRLRIFGFYSNMNIAISAYTFESLSLDVEGLVE